MSPDESSSPPQPPPPIRLFYVDDEPSLVTLAERKLGGMGYEITSFTSSREALDHFQNDPSRYDVVVSDMSMPEISGEQLIRMIHRLRPNIPVIMITGFEHEINASDAQRLNVIGFLNKPFRMEELDERIRAMVFRS